MKSLTEAWLTAAKNDMDVIGRIIADDHLTHIVAFHAQQAVEKCFEALMEESTLSMPEKFTALLLCMQKLKYSWFRTNSTYA